MLLKASELKWSAEHYFQWGQPTCRFVSQSHTFSALHAKTWCGWSVCVVMCFSLISTDTSLGFPYRICEFPEWLALQKIYPLAMEEAQAAEAEVDLVPREVEYVAVALRVAKGCTSSRWLREPGQWPFTIRTLSNKTASLSTVPSSSSARTISSGSMQSE